MIDFPINPSLNQIFTSPAGKKWKWNGVKWSGFGSESTGSPIIISDTAPVGALNGQLWFDSTSGITSIYYDDVWVDVGGGDSNDELSPLNVVDSPTLDFSYSASTRTLSANTVFKEFSFRNKIINGNFDFWQRGTSLASGTGGRYLADRWFVEAIGSTYTSDRQTFTYGQTEVPGQPDYFHRAVVSSVVGTNNYTALVQRIENGATLANKTATITFWAKTDAAKSISAELIQRFGNGLTSPNDVSIYCGKFQLTTSWQRFSTTINVPSIAGKSRGTNTATDFLQLGFFFDAGTGLASRTNSLGQQSGTFDIAQVQLEEGPIATPFEQRPYGTELTLCQRYFHQFVDDDLRISTYQIGGSDLTFIYKLPVTMRVAPTITQPTWTDVNVTGSPIMTATSPNSVKVGGTASVNGAVQWTNVGGIASAEL